MRGKEDNEGLVVVAVALVVVVVVAAAGSGGETMEKLCPRGFTEPT